MAKSSTASMAFSLRPQGFLFRNPWSPEVRGLQLEGTSSGIHKISDKPLARTIRSTMMTMQTEPTRAKT